MSFESMSVNFEAYVSDVDLCMKVDAKWEN